VLCGGAVQQGNVLCCNVCCAAGQFSNVAALLWHVAKHTAPPTLPAGLSPDLHDFCALCFRRDPAERPSARRLLRHPLVALWNADAPPRQRPAPSGAAAPAGGGGGGGDRLSVANRRISALF
jgi:hypothetical protein